MIYALLENEEQSAKVANNRLSLNRNEINLIHMKVDSISKRKDKPYGGKACLIHKDIKIK